ncbi:histone-fold-containing protein [Panus rudis PR-1116 ss-1]|nr:histone-fold-containing protein [Panus rudis PR-1116 ss-1]
MEVEPSSTSSQEIHTTTITTETTEPVQPKQKKRKDANAQPTRRENGKSLLPFSRVQKILKADKELPIVAREATILISIATEEFIKQFAEEMQMTAARDNRVTVQYKDAASVVRRADKFMFLDEIIPSQSVENQAKRKPRAQKGEDQAKPATMLDHFVQKAPATEDEASQEPNEDIVMNEDGTMTVVGS